MTKHTPGPWVPGPYGDVEWSEGIICNVLPTPKDRSVRAANARLIAAAPETAAERDRLKESNSDLLAALKQAYDAINPTDKVWISLLTWGERLRLASMNITMAIRKAEGEEAR